MQQEKITETAQQLEKEEGWKDIMQRQQWQLKLFCIVEEEQTQHTRVALPTKSFRLCIHTTMMHLAATWKLKKVVARLRQEEEEETDEGDQDKDLHGWRWDGLVC